MFFWPETAQKAPSPLRSAEQRIFEIGCSLSTESSVLGLFIGLVERVGPQTAKNWCEVLSAVKTAVEAETRTADR